MAQRVAAMADAQAAAGGKPRPAKGKKKVAAAEEEQPPPPFKPGKRTFYDRQVVDYVRTATARNIWYYRCS